MCGVGDANSETTAVIGNRVEGIHENHDCRDLIL